MSGTAETIVAKLRRAVETGALTYISVAKNQSGNWACAYGGADNAGIQMVSDPDFFGSMDKALKKVSLTRKTALKCDNNYHNQEHVGRRNSEDLI